jgi:hypothetical protein
MISDDGACALVPDWLTDMYLKSFMSILLCGKINWFFFRALLPQVMLQLAINRYFVSRLATVILIFSGDWCAQKGLKYIITTLLLWTFVHRLFGYLVFTTCRKQPLFCHQIILELCGVTVIGLGVFVRSFSCLSPFVAFTDVQFMWTISRPLVLQYTGMCVGW